jgi:DNA mismatch endonuclease (patch repair protein)
MRVTPQRDTRPELALRTALHSLGLRYRVDARPIDSLRRRADVVFPRARVAVFLDGCFWHGCDLHMTWPAANAEWWRAKIGRTQVRDRETDATLRAAGWCVIRVWEHEDPVEAAQTIRNAVVARLDVPERGPVRLRP